MQTRAERPNLLFVITDQQRFDSLGCSGNADAITPAIDKLAANGVRFESAYAAQPVCSPSRSTIFTGMYPHKTEVWDNDITLLDHGTSFPRLMKQAGYVTGYIGKWHLGPRPDIKTYLSPVDPPPAYFDVWKGHEGRESYWIGQAKNDWSAPLNHETAIPAEHEKMKQGRYLVDAETDEAITFLQANSKVPFCLTVSYTPPHNPWTAPLENCLRFKDKVRYPTYHAMVNRIDENVGRMVAKLEELGIRDNTLVVFTSDHGHTFKYRWNPQPKRTCYDESARVPLIFSWSGKIPTGTRDIPISLVDLAPTILDLCGVRPPAGVHGRSAVPYLLNENAATRTSAYFQNHPFRMDGFLVDKSPGSDSQWAAMYERCLVTREWKLILSSDRPSELYDRARDPDEQTNRFADPGHHLIREKLIEEMTTWARDVNDGMALSKWLIFKPRSTSAKAVS